MFKEAFAAAFLCAKTDLGFSLYYRTAKRLRIRTRKYSHTCPAWLISSANQRVEDASGKIQRLLPSIATVGQFFAGHLSSRLLLSSLAYVILINSATCSTFLLPSQLCATFSKHRVFLYKDDVYGASAVAISEDAFRGRQLHRRFSSEPAAMNKRSKNERSKNAPIPHVAAEFQVENNWLFSVIQQAIFLLTHEKGLFPSNTQYARQLKSSRIVLRDFILRRRAKVITLSERWRKVGRCVI